MKILFVNNFRGRGGGEEFLRDLLPGLLRKGNQIGLVCRPNTPLTAMFEGSGVDLLPLDRSGTGAITSVFAISRLIRKRGYEIVNIQRGHDIIQSAVGAGLSGKRPILIYTPQVPEFIRSHFLLRRMDAIVTISRHIQDRLTAFDPALKQRTSIVYYGIDLERFTPGAIPRGWLRNRFALGRDTKVIGTVGDLWKNQIEFLDVLAILRKRSGDVRYAIVGSDRGSSAVDVFRRRAEELGLTDKVLWPGRLAKEEMIKFYADIDLAVSTYRNEGFGIWVLEAMAMGKPAMSFNAGGIRDSLEGSPCGVLVDGGAREMAAALSELLADSDRMTAMGEAAPQWVKERFSRERMVNDYDRYFRSLLNDRRGQSD
jgi:glycosyltransferase involved in cell wall biosynthesis